MCFFLNEMILVGITYLFQHVCVSRLTVHGEYNFMYYQVYGVRQLRIFQLKNHVNFAEKVV